MENAVQRPLCCPEILALGMCPTCYTLKRQDEEYFGGLREQVLERDEHRCRVCGASGRDKRSIIVHHRVPGVSKLDLMIALCPGCHAKVHRTRVALTAMPPLYANLIIVQRCTSVYPNATPKSADEQQMSRESGHYHI
jgi:hypothetical protein